MDRLLKAVLALVFMTIFSFGGFIFAFQDAARPERSRPIAQAQAVETASPDQPTPQPAPAPLRSSMGWRGRWHGGWSDFGEGWRWGMSAYGSCNDGWMSREHREGRCDAMGMRRPDACDRNMGRRGLSQPNLLPDAERDAIPPEVVSFKRDVKPIFESRCVSCHGGAAGLYLDSYDNALRGGVYGPVIIPGEPESSRLIQVVSSGYMPLNGPPLTPVQVRTLANWVAAGAPNN